MYPIRFDSLYFSKIWGGRALEQFRTDVPAGLIGESWDIACHQHGVGVVANGQDKGKTFSELIAQYGSNLVGRNVSQVDFPLLVKIITAEEDLSIQVHPDDHYAQEHEQQLGKNEAWYVLAARENACLYLGVKPGCEQAFKQCLENGGDLISLLNRVPVRKGDSFFIPSGCVHAIGAGVIVAEIQQSSDVTYRLYDYGRPREIQIEKGLAVTNCELTCPNLRENASQQLEYGTKQVLTKNAHFTIEQFTIVEQTITFSSNPEYFEIITCVDGEGVILAAGYEQAVRVGTSYLIPASLGSYQLEGTLKFLKSNPHS